MDRAPDDVIEICDLRLPIAIADCDCRFERVLRSKSVIENQELQNPKLPVSKIGSGFADRKSEIANCKYQIGNRKSEIANRQ